MLNFIASLTAQPEVQAISPLGHHHSRFSTWVKEHPVIATVSALAATGFSYLALTRGNVLFQVVGTALAAYGAITLVKVTKLWKHIFYGNALVPLASLLGYQHRTGESQASFEIRQCWEGIGSNAHLLGELHYETQGDRRIPVLDIHCTEPRQMGYVHGYLLGEQIIDLFPRLVDPMITSVSVLLGDFRRKDLNARLDAIHIPETYQREFEGVLEGVRAYARKRNLPPPSVTLRDLKMFHCFPDVYKAIGCQNILGIKSLNALGCSTVVIKKNNQIAVGSNIDWFSMGLVGPHLHLRRYRVKNADDTLSQVESVGVPALIGVVRARNEHGLVAVINEGGTGRNPAGVPYILHARRLLDKAKSVAELEDLLSQEIDSSAQPASSHILTATDRNTAKVFQMHMQDGKFYSVRGLTAIHESTSAVVATNHFLDEDGDVIVPSMADGTSRERHTSLRTLVQEQLAMGRSPETILVSALKSVNRVVTINSTIVDRLGRFHCTFDNYHAAGHFPENLS